MKIIDCYSGLDELLLEASSIKEKQEIWQNFMKEFPTIKKMCINDYTKDGHDWKKISSKIVFNYNKEFITEMTNTSRLIKEIIVEMTGKLNGFFNLEKDDIIFVIYHGLGNAAGWASKYKGNIAIYLGLEKIVELNWNNKKKLEDLVAHEYSHLVHASVRKGSLSPYRIFKKKVLFRLYTEGVATYCEALFNGRESSSKKWHREAHIKRDLLKREFLSRLKGNSDNIFDFFGDWKKVYGLNEAGYFLGLEMIQELTKEFEIIDIMKMDYNTIEKYSYEYLNNHSKF